jgi:hypothetical protein
MGSSLGNSLKVNAREFVPGSGGFASPGQGVSPPSATAAAAAAAANAAGGLRVAAHEFRPGGPAAAAGAAGAAAAAAEDTLLNQFLSGQLIQANTQTLGVYLSQGDEQFGIQTIYMERVGVVSQGQVALLMYNQDTGTLHGVWSAQHKEHANTAQELVAFRRERMLPPLPVAEVQGYLQWQGGAVRLPQKIAAANVSGAALDMPLCLRSVGAAGLLSAHQCVAPHPNWSACISTCSSADQTNHASLPRPRALPAGHRPCSSSSSSPCRPGTCPRSPRPCPASRGSPAGAAVSAGAAGTAGWWLVGRAGAP